MSCPTVYPYVFLCGISESCFWNDLSSGTEEGLVGFVEGEALLGDPDMIIEVIEFVTVG